MKARSLAQDPRDSRGRITCINAGRANSKVFEDISPKHRALGAEAPNLCEPESQGAEEYYWYVEAGGSLADWGQGRNSSTRLGRHGEMAP